MELGAWGRQLRAAAAERADGSRGWDSVSGRRGLRLPEVSSRWTAVCAQRSGRRRSGTRTFGVGFPSCACFSPACGARLGGNRVEELQGTTALQSKFAICLNPTGCCDPGPYP